MDLDALNTSAGKLLEVFFATCPPLDQIPQPFDAGVPRTMRDAIIATKGRSGLVVRYRLIESLGYFLNADRLWTEEHLLAPLQAETAEALALWRAISHHTHTQHVLQIIGNAMSERAIDQRLDRDSRQMLVFNLVLESLYALKAHREPAVANARVQQMIRSLEDEVRAHGAETIRRFVSEYSSSSDGTPAPTAESLFRDAAAPFLRQVWPQEQSLVTPGVSRALASLPVASKGEFAEAVGAVERFLRPFDCWSMFEYGFYAEEDDRPTFSLVDTHEKAEALLLLLDRTVGTTEGAVIPNDLPDALEHIRNIAPQLASSVRFRRLATAARRL